LVALRARGLSSLRPGGLAVTTRLPSGDSAIAVTGWSVSRAISLQWDRSGPALLAAKAKLLPTILRPRAYRVGRADIGNRLNAEGHCGTLERSPALVQAGLASGRRMSVGILFVARVFGQALRSLQAPRGRTSRAEWCTSSGPRYGPCWAGYSATLADANQHPA